MYQSGDFEEQGMTNWEKKATADMTYTNAKSYFQENYKEKIMFRESMARNMGHANMTLEMEISSRKH